MNLKDNYKETSEKLFSAAGISPQSKFITTKGPVKNVHYYEIGAGEPLILIHGGGGHAVQWYPMIKSLGEKYHLYIPDRPGCGLTDPFNYNGVDVPDHSAEFISSFMDALNIPQANILGNSLGGFFGVNFALKYPGKVKKLLLIGHPPGGTRKMPLMFKLMGTKGVNTLLVKMMGAPNKKNTKEFYGQMLVADNSKLSDDFLENDICAVTLPETQKSFLSLIENCVSILSGFKKSYLISPKMKDLKMPVRFIIGDKDKLDTLDNVRQIISGMKDGQMDVAENCGHIPWLDKPDLCTNLVLQHLN